jgi:Integrase core domain
LSTRFAASASPKSPQNGQQRKLSSWCFSGCDAIDHRPPRSTTGELMKQPTVYLKMRVLGALDSADGRTRHQRVLNVAAMTFLDEDGNPRQFTWRTIQTWFYRYKNHGITGMTNHSRSDKGQTRKITPEELLEALNAAKPHFRNHQANKRALYRFCIENGLLHAERIAQTTFYRFIREYDLLSPEDHDHKKRLAFSMKYANQLWQADTMFGPPVECPGKGRKQTRLIAFIDDASRVLCHGEFFFEENVDTLVQAIRAAFYKRGVPEQLLVDNGSIYSGQEITLICARVGCILRHTAGIDGPDRRAGSDRCAMPLPRAKLNASSAASATSSSFVNSTFRRSNPLTASSATGLKAITTLCPTTPSA